MPGQCLIRLPDRFVEAGDRLPLCWVPRGMPGRAVSPCSRLARVPSEPEPELQARGSRLPEPCVNELDHGNGHLGCEYLRILPSGWLGCTSAGKIGSARG